MKYRINRLFVKLSILIIVAFPIYMNSAGADETDKCASIKKDVSVESTLATAAFLANEENKPGSIRYESDSLMDRAEGGASTAQKPGGLCPAGCQLNTEPVVVFKAVPRKFLTSYSDYNKCEKLLEQTEKSPFSYNEQFNSITDVESWFSNFSRGKGPDGQDLYNRCSGQCSPQYEFFITNDGGKLGLNADVVCGHARDKSDDKYIISYSYRWKCQSN